MAGGRDRQARVKLAQAAGLAGGIGKTKKGKPACDIPRFTYNDDSAVSVTSETASTCSTTTSIVWFEEVADSAPSPRSFDRDLTFTNEIAPYALHRHIPAFLCMLASKPHGKLLTLVRRRKPNRLTCVESLTQCFAMAFMYGMLIGDVVL